MSYLLDHDKVSGSGSFILGLAGEALGNRKLVYLGVDGLWRLADANAAASMPAVGLTMTAIASGESGWILTDGWIGLSTWTWTAGGELYVSTVAGELTQVAPPAAGVLVQIMGVASTATQIKFSPHYGPPGDLSNTLEGSTAYVGFDETKEPKVNYFLVDGTADDVQINAAEAYITALGGGTVELERGTYVLADPIIPTGNNIWYKGQGPATLLNGDGLATTEHVFHLTGRDDIRITSMNIQTEDGGGKTSHCIFIEDGSDRFHIEEIEILDSDDDGIHIEGTNIIGGVIINCEILDIDGEGIFVDMDGGNEIVNLAVRGVTIRSAGANGMLLSDVHDSEITENIIDDSTGDGLELLANCDDNIIKNNEIDNNGAYGINIAAATSADNIVKDNRLQGNVTAPCLDNGTLTIFETKQYYVARDDDNINQTPGKSITNGQTAYLGVHAPLGIQQIMKFHIYVIPQATQANANWDLAASYGGVGEANNIHTEAENVATYNVTDLQWFEIDALAAGMFVSMVSEDTGGVSLTVSTAGHNVMVVMAEMYYV